MGSLLRNTVFLLSNPTFLLSQPVISLIVTCSGGSDPSADQDLFSAWECLVGWNCTKRGHHHHHHHCHSCCWWIHHSVRTSPSPRVSEEPQCEFLVFSGAAGWCQCSLSSSSTQLSSGNKRAALSMQDSFQACLCKYLLFAQR